MPLHDWRFVHVPKTGGKSVAAALEFETRAHLPASYDAATLQRYNHEYGSFMFGFVRNPYDRLQSAWYFRQRGNTNIPVENYAPGFEDFVLTERLEQAMKYDKVFAPMCDYLDAPVGFIGRFETLREDFGRVCRILGVEAELRHENASEHPHWTDIYTDAMLLRVNDLYAQDFKRFGYEMQNA